MGYLDHLKGSSGPVFRAMLDARERTAELGKQIRRSRERKGLTAAELAQRTGVDAEKVERLELGLSVDLCMDELYALACAVGLTVTVSLDPAGAGETEQRSSDRP